MDLSRRGVIGALPVGLAMLLLALPPMAEFVSGMFKFPSQLAVAMVWAAPLITPFLAARVRANAMLERNATRKRDDSAPKSRV